MNTLVKPRSVFSPKLINHDFFWGNPFQGLRNEWNETAVAQPAVNIKENDEYFELNLAAPGFNKEQFAIKLEKNTLEISGKQNSETTEREDNYLRREFAYQDFKRSFTLAEGKIKSDQISANYQDGILKIRLPKATPSESIAKQIEIQ